jgi:serine/threonine protein kinase
MEQHRADLRHFIQESIADVTLLEVEPTSFEEVAASINWADHDLLLIDNHLGAEDGISWVERFRMDQAFPPVIFVSSSDRDSAEANRATDAGLRLGARGFLFKRPLDLKALSSHIGSVLGVQPQSEPARADIFVDDIDLLPDITPPPTMVEPDTFHEMRQAKAMLHGHDRWPFSVQDLQAGEAEFAGYHIHKYMGERDGLYFFEGSDLSDQKKYVVKLVDQSFMNEDSLSPIVREEFNRILQWNHPNVVRWIDYREVDGHLIVIEEYQEGESLFHRLSKSRVTRTQAEIFSRQILQALSFLHKQGVRAGALTPEKMVLRTREDLMLTHFDVLGKLVLPEKLDVEKRQLTFNEAVYLSPELIQKQKADHRSDLYIAGVIIHQLFTGEPPYNQGTTKTVLTDHVASPVPSMKTENTALNQLVRRLLDKLPENRPQSAGEVLDLLTASLDDEDGAI